MHGDEMETASLALDGNVLSIWVRSATLDSSMLCASLAKAFDVALPDLIADPPSLLCAVDFWSFDSQVSALHRLATLPRVGGDNDSTDASRGSDDTTSTIPFDFQPSYAVSDGGPLVRALGGGCSSSVSSGKSGGGGDCTSRGAALLELHAIHSARTVLVARAQLDLSPLLGSAGRAAVRAAPLVLAADALVAARGGGGPAPPAGGGVGVGAVLGSAHVELELARPIVEVARLYEQP